MRPVFTRGFQELRGAEAKAIEVKSIGNSGLG